MSCEDRIREAEEKVQEFYNVIDSVKGLSKKDIQNQLQEMKADVAQ